MKPTVPIMRRGGAYLETLLVGRTWFGPVALSPWVTVEPCWWKYKFFDGMVLIWGTYLAQKDAAIIGQVLKIAHKD